MNAGAGPPSGGATSDREGPLLTTRRLQLRPFDDGDVAGLHALFTDADVRRWLLDDTLVPLAWVEEEVDTSRARFAQGSAGLWTVREAGRSEIVGFAGFRPFWEPPELELIYGLHPSRWGLGYATEAALAALGYAFDVLGFDEVLAATDVPNTESIAVLERLGFREWKRTDAGVAGTVRFNLDSVCWRDRLTNHR